MAAIHLTDVRKRYGAVEAIHGIDLDVADGEFVVLVGPSGCGKSTLLRMVAGLEEITAGAVSIGGRVVNGLEPKDRDVAMVFQNYALYPHMDVYANMSYGLRIRGMKRAEIDERVRRAAEILGLSALLGRRPRELSGGQRQRVAMGRAIVREPQAFLFDEPLSNLDAKLRVQMRLEIQRLHRRLRTTSLYVTHDQVEAMSLADRLVVMNAGRAEQIGAPHDVYARPATAFVAGFLGSPPMNLLRGRVDAEGRRFLPPEPAAGAIAAGPLRLSQPRADLAGRALLLGLRPEALRHEPGNPQADDRLRVAIEQTEALGAETLVHGRWGDEPVIWRVDARDAPHDGQTASLALPAAPLHWFDAETGRRIEG